MCVHVCVRGFDPPTVVVVHVRSKANEAKEANEDQVRPEHLHELMMSIFISFFCFCFCFFLASRDQVGPEHLDELMISIFISS